MNANTIGSPGLVSIAVPPEQQTESLWTTAQAAQVLNRPERSVRRLVQKGEIKGFKVRGKFGEEWRIMPFSLEQKSGAHTPAEECGNNLCFEVPKEERITDEIKTVAATDTTQSTPSVWNNVLTILKSMLFWISKGEKPVNQIVEY